MKEFNRSAIVVLAIITFSCSTRTNESIKYDQSTVLVNAGEKNKEELALLIDRIAGCEPKVIGVNLIFNDGGTRRDTLLANSIRNSGNVILTSMHEDGKYFTSDTLFRESSLGEGLFRLGIDDDSIVTSQMLFVSIGTELKWSFPMTVVAHYDAEKGVSAMKKALGNEYYEIEYVTEGNKFLVLDEIDAVSNCDVIKGKIVLIGFLGPADEDSFLVPNGEKKYATWILANCVRDILNGHFVKIDHK